MKVRDRAEIAAYFEGQISGQCKPVALNNTNYLFHLLVTPILFLPLLT
jgi:hypothetical protein